MHEVLVNRLGDLSLPRRRVHRLTDCPDMTSAVYLGRKITKQNNYYKMKFYEMSYSRVTNARKEANFIG